MRYPYLVVLSVAVIFFAPLSSAEGQPAPLEQPSSPLPAAESWQTQFEQARSLLLNGSFAAAEARFAELSFTAPSLSERKLANEMASLCKYWESGGYTLVTGGPGEFRKARVRSGTRSSGEIASLYSSSVFYGLGSGIALSVMSEPDSASGVILPSLALAGGAAALVYSLDKSPLKSGVPNSISTGLTLGLTHGLAWTLWNQASVKAEDEWSAKTVVGMIWASSTAGAILGGVVGAKRGTSPGRASMMGSASLWTGAVLGLASATIPSESQLQDDVGLLAAAVGLSGGAVLGYVVGEKHNPSTARVRYLDLGGIVGGLVATGLYISAAENDTDDRTLLGIAAAGMATGIGSAWYLSRDMAQEGEEEEATWTTGVMPASTGNGALVTAQGQF